MATGSGQIPPNYLKLVRRFPLRVTRFEGQYDEAVEIVQGLAVRGEDDLDGGERDYFDALTSLVESYEAANYRVGPDGLLPHQRVKWLAEESGLSQARLAKLLGVGQPLVSLILQGERELTLSNVSRLSDYFHIDPRYFIKAG